MSIALSVDGHFAQLDIGDQGPGINDELRQRLFQPFSAGHEQSGSGLGLAICQEIVLALGGSITLSNVQLGDIVTGMVARVRLPLKRASALRRWSDSVAELRLRTAS